ncbi:MAG: sulfotransferase [Actinobacteria bacterium]|nr:sulfotransferase [Actinomycetota bacterium]
MNIIYILSYERSGSTLFHNVLGQIEGFFSVGELRYFADRFHDTRPCGCGDKVTDCHFWRKVIAKFPNINMQTSKIPRYIKGQYLPIIFLPFSKILIRLIFSRHLTYINQLYKAIEGESRSLVIIDSSKSPIYCYLLSLIPEINLKIIHLIRSVYGVEYSLYKRKQTGHPKYQKHNPLYGSVRWVLSNIVSTKLVKKIGVPYKQIKYEQFILNPEKTVKLILDWLHMRDLNIDFIYKRGVTLYPTHSVGGSPSRHITGEVPLKLDIDWKKNLPQLYKTIISIIARPLLIKYGYY